MNMENFYKYEKISNLQIIDNLKDKFYFDYFLYINLHTIQRLIVSKGASS